jgi:hypothetical protein
MMIQRRAAGDAGEERAELAEFRAGWVAAGYATTTSVRIYERRLRRLADRLRRTVAEVRADVHADAAAILEAEGASA